MNKLIIYCTQLRKEEKSLYLEARTQGLNAEYVLVKDGFKTTTDVPSIGLIRVLSHEESSSVANINHLAGNITVNSPDIIKYCTDKSLTAILLQKHEIPQPKFRIAFSLKHLKEIAMEFPIPFVVKPISSSWGRGLCRIGTLDCLNNWLAGRESLNASHNEGYPLLLQEYIDKPGYDLRVLVVGNEPIVAFKRVSDHWITNTHLGAAVEPITMNSELKLIVDKIINALGSGFYGIDLFETKNGEYLCNEINHNPDFSFSSSIHKINVAQHMIGYLKNAYF